ncbi:hypothetical protein Bbelb_306900 [Branchiostoma belcheri]|nr:hypothetical protein Bbelb_306900 [Branchiostoma belcheri]
MAYSHHPARAHTTTFGLWCTDAGHGASTMFNVYLTRIRPAGADMCSLGPAGAKATKPLLYRHNREEMRDEPQGWATAREEQSADLAGYHLEVNKDTFQGESGAVLELLTGPPSARRERAPDTPSETFKVEVNVCNPVGFNLTHEGSHHSRRKASASQNTFAGSRDHFQYMKESSESGKQLLDGIRLRSRALGKGTLHDFPHFAQLNGAELEKRRKRNGSPGGRLMQ